MAPKFGSFETRSSSGEEMCVKPGPSSGEPLLRSDSQESSNGYKEKETYSYKKQKFVWHNIIMLSVVHILALYGWYRFLTIDELKWKTAIATFLFGIFSSFGITAGAHRLWSHRSYKARWPLRY